MFVKILSIQLIMLLAMATGLPITSKPIENTAEKLAWDAWLMLPPEQKNLEKSRKVTPKSIFTIPFRQCPEGHQLFENRCIPTVNIDQSTLLNEQLLGLVFANNGGPDYGGPLNYDELDYNDGEYNDGPMTMFDPAQKLNGFVGPGGAAPETYDDPSKLPSQDEPLKFNIFQQKFPADYDGVADSGLNATANGTTSATQQPPMNILELMQEYLKRHMNTSVSVANHTGNATAVTISSKININNNNNNNNNNTDSDDAASSDAATADLQTSESSNISTIVAAKAVTENDPSSTKTTTNAVDIQAPFSISDIDAIALPAGVMNTAMHTVSGGEGHVAVALEPHQYQQQQQQQQQQEQTEHKSHRISLFKDDSAVQLVTTVLTTAKKARDEHTNDATVADENNEKLITRTTTTTTAAQPDISQLLKVDALLPLFNITQAKATNMTNEDNTTTKTTILMSDDDSYDVDDLILSGTAEAEAESQENEDKMTIKFDSMGDDEGDAEGDTTTMLPPTDAVEFSASSSNKKKGERSVVELPPSDNSNEFEAETEEDARSTSPTPPAEETTHIQLDDTTVIESSDTPSIAMQELLMLGMQEQQKPKHTAEHNVLKKSKVEPVVVDVDLSLLFADATQNKKPSTTTTTPLPLKAGEAIKATESLTAAAANRFDNQEPQEEQQQRNGGDIQLSVPGDQPQRFTIEPLDAEEAKQMGPNGGSGAIKPAKASTTTAAVSEINIDQELRMINDLVKGKRPAENKGASTAATTEASTLPATTESSAPASGEIDMAEAKATSALGPSDNSKIMDNKNLPPTTTTINATSENLIKESAGGNFAKVIDDARVSTSTPAITTERQAEETGTPQAPKWGKVLPKAMEAASSSSSTTATESTLTITKVEEDGGNDNATPAITALGSDSSGHLLSISNRSNRNSKITRINSFNPPGASGSNSITITKATTTTTTTEEPSSSSSTAADESLSSTESSVDSAKSSPASSSEPFWWVPMGWRLDGSVDVPTDSAAEAAADVGAEGLQPTQPLFLRFWSAFPGGSSTTATSSSN